MQKHKKGNKASPGLNETRLWQLREEICDTDFTDYTTRPMKKVKKTNSSEYYNHQNSAKTLMLSLPNQGQQTKPAVVIKDIVRNFRSVLPRDSNDIENIVFVSNKLDTAYVNLKHKVQVNDILEKFTSEGVNIAVETVPEMGFNVNKEVKRNPKWKCFDIDKNTWRRRKSSLNLKNETANGNYLNDRGNEDARDIYEEPMGIRDEAVNIKKENRALRKNNKRLKQNKEKLAHEKEILLQKIEKLKKQFHEHEENIAKISEEEANVRKRKESLRQKVQETERLYMNIIADTKATVPANMRQTPDRRISRETEEFITSGRQTRERSSRRKGLEGESSTRLYQSAAESAKMHIKYDDFDLPEHRESARKGSVDKDRLKAKESLTKQSLTKQNLAKQSLQKDPPVEPAHYILIEDFDQPEHKESLRKGSMDMDWLKGKESLTKQSAAKQSLTKQSLTKQSLTKQSLTKQSLTKLSASKQSLTKQDEWNAEQFESLQRMRDEPEPIYNHRSLSAEKWLSSHVIDDYLDLKYPYQANVTIFKTYALPQIGKCVDEQKFTLAKLIRSYLKPVTEAQEIFEKTALIFPVNTFGSHWSLFVVCNPFCILKSQEDQSNEQLSFIYLDSKYHRADKPYDQWALSFLKECAEECGEEINEEIFSDPPKMFFPCVAKQTNDTDCGLFMLDYIDTMNNLMSYERRDHIELYKREEIRQELMNFL